MPEDAVDESAEAPEGTTDADTHADAASEEQVASEQETTAGAEDSSGEVDVDSLKKEVAELRSLKGKMGQELGRYRQRFGGLDADESANADTGGGETTAADEAAEPEDDEQDVRAARKQLGNELSQAVILGDLDKVETIFDSIATRSAQKVLAGDRAVQSDRAFCAEAYGHLLGKDALAKHDKAAAKTLRQNPGMGYRAAFLVAAHGDLLNAAEARGAKAKEKDLTAGNGGKVATGGKPTRPTGRVDLRKAISDVRPYGDSGGEFDKM